MTRHFRTLEDISSAQLDQLLSRAEVLAQDRTGHPTLAGKSVAVVFEKASTRTRISFEVGIHELGALPVTLMARDTQMGRGEPLSDTARMLSGYVNGVVYRTFGHDRVEALCAAATIPVINGLSDSHHPCQLLADMLTIRQVKGRLKGLSVAWIGDGNNMAHSWILSAARGEFSLRLACPEGYMPDPAVVERGRSLGADISLTTDPREAAENADVITTDVWASMGQEDEAKAREEAFASFQVTPSLMNSGQDAIFLHCLPAHRGEEVAGEVIDGPWSQVWREAENRLHAQKALLEMLLR